LHVVTSPSSAPSPADVQATFAATLVDEWVRAGVTHAVVCPGSRSTPLALAVTAHDGLAVQVHHDERSAGFLALGLGLATGRPALVIVTSGTAAAELHPAVVEAHQAGVPLVVCTADRPPELQDVGGPQVIDQTHLYGRAVRWFADPGVPVADGADRWRPLAARAVAEATGDRPGPVQLNLAFREPLVGTVGPLPAARRHGPWTRLVVPASSSSAVPSAVATDVHSALPATVPSAVVGELAGLAGRRGVLVAGEGSGDGDAVHAVATALGWPVLADPRAPAWRPGPATIAHLDALLRSPVAAERLRPEVVVRLGPPPASRVVGEWLAASGAEEVVVAGRSWSDPAGTAGTVVRAEPNPVVAAWAATPTTADPPAGWLTAWQAAGAAAAGALAGHLDAPAPGGDAIPVAGAELASVPAPGDAVPALGGGVPGGAPADGGATEPGVARAAVAALPDGAWLVVSSSMPVRDVERYAVPRTGVRIAANRGANGIDGVTSTAVGVAAGTGGPTALLIGDVAFLHDANGLLGAAGRGIDLVVVVVDNDGGGIFSFLPQARSVGGERFERLFGTPHGLDLVAVAAAFGVEARRLDDGAEVAGAVRDALDKGGVHVLVVRTDRAANVAVHQRLDDAVAAAVTAALAH
jgi:2-succinyl-5-enolpyruvyl-6-hydroxy-3-cyclohexene-1-carboxylate synthase